MKGPDLLNNLFGILVRFRENEVAISADVSKMVSQSPNPGAIPALTPVPMEKSGNGSKA